MSSDRAKRIKMLQWYTLGGYRLYFVKLGEYRAKIFLRNQPTEKPVWNFSAPTMKELVKKIDDDLCLNSEGKTFRYRKEEHIGIAHPEMLMDLNATLVAHPVVPDLNTKKVSKKKNRISTNKDCMEEKVKLWSELYESLKHQRILAVMNIMLCALAVALLLWK